MIWKRFEGKIIEYVKKEMEDGSHGFDHVLRVVKLAQLIGSSERADMDVLMPAAYLHDVARKYEKFGMDHAEVGARMARDFLEKIGYPKDKISQISHAIEVHRYKSKGEPRTLEAIILKEADMLDAMGAIGVYRTVYHSCETGRSLEDTIRHLEEKILKLKNMMKTKTAAKIARKRHEFVESFLKNLKFELNPP